MPNILGFEIGDKVSEKSLSDLIVGPRSATATTNIGAPIDTSRPMIENPDRTFSTERTITIESDGDYYNIPTIVGGQQLSEEDAIAAWHAGNNPDVGKFGSQDEAETAARARSAQIGRLREPERAARDDVTRFARARGLLGPPPAPGGVPGAVDLKKPPTWNWRASQEDYLYGTVEDKKKIEGEWLTMVQDYAEKRFPKTKDRDLFMSPIYDQLPHTELPKRSIGERIGELWGKFSERTITDVVRPFGLFAGVSEETDPNSIKYLFTRKGSEEASQAYIDTAESARSREIERIKEQRFEAAAKEGAFEMVKAVGKYFLDYPEMLTTEVVGLAPLIMETYLGGRFARALAEPLVLPRVAAGKLAAEKGGVVLGRAGQAGTALVYGPTFAAQTYDEIYDKVRQIPKEKWETDPAYQQLRQAHPELKHQELVDRIAKDRAFWPSIGAGTIGAILAPLGLEGALVGPRSGTLWKAITRAVMEPTGEAIEEVTQEGAGNYQVQKTVPEQELFPGVETARRVSEVAVATFPLGLLGGGLEAFGGARGRRGEVPPQYQPGQAPGQPPPLPEERARAAAGGGAAAQPGGPPGLAGAPVGPAPETAQDVVAQAIGQVGEDVFAERLQGALEGRNLEEMSDQEQEALVERVAKDVLREGAGRPGEAPGRPPPPTPEERAHIQRVASAEQEASGLEEQARGLEEEAQPLNPNDLESIRLRGEAEDLKRQARRLREESFKRPPDEGPGPPPGGGGAGAGLEVAPRAETEAAPTPPPDKRAAANAARRKAQLKINQTEDSLMTAIAKLGGLDRDQLASTWGTELKDVPGSGVFGLPVVRKVNGLTLDDMATQLGHLGYLPVDEHGKADLRAFEELFDKELRGQKQYAPPGQERMAKLDAERRNQLDEEQAEANRQAAIDEAMELTPEELTDAGYFQADGPTQAAAEQLVATLRDRFKGTEAEAQIDQILERAAIQAENDPSPEAFQRAVAQQLEEITRGRREEAQPAREAEAAGRGAREAAPPAGPAERPALELAQPTPGELARREAERVAPPPEAPPPGEFALTGSDRAADRAIAQGQRELLDANVDEAPTTEPMFHESTPDAPVVYLSGLSRAADFTAALERGANVGVEIGELTDEAMRQLAAAIVKTNGQVFVDSGAFSVFRANLRRGGEQFTMEEFGSGGKALNFDEIMRRYEALAQAVARADPTGAANDRVFYVMPDIVGDQAGSLDLISRYAEFIRGHSTGILPLQVGELSLAEAYADALKRLDVTGGLIVGIPSNERAAPNEQISELLKTHGDDIFGVHFLGAASQKRLGPKLELAKQAGWDGPTSADSNALRSNLRGGTGRAEAFAKAIEETAGERAQLRAENAKIKKQRDDLVTEARGNDDTLIGRMPNNRSLLLTPSVSPDNVGGYRVTRFEGEEPTGHSEYRTIEEAVGEFMHGVVVDNDTLRAVLAGTQELDRQTRMLNDQAAQAHKEGVIQDAIETLRRSAESRKPEAPRAPGVEAAPAERPTRRAPRATREGEKAPVRAAAPEQPRAKRAARKVPGGEGLAAGEQATRAKRPSDEARESGAAGETITTGRKIPADRKHTITSARRKRTLVFPNPADRTVWQVGDWINGPKHALAMAKVETIARYLGVTPDEAIEIAKRYRDKTLSDTIAVAGPVNQIVMPSAIETGPPSVPPSDVSPSEASHLKGEVPNLETKYFKFLDALDYKEQYLKGELEQFHDFINDPTNSREDAMKAVAHAKAIESELAKIQEEREQLKKRWAVYKKSKKVIGTPSTEGRIVKALAGIFGINEKDINAKLLPRVEIRSEHDLDARGTMQLRDGSVIHGITPTSIAFYVPSANRIVVLKERVSLGRERPILFHEFFHKRGGQLLGEKELARIRGEVEGWKDAPIGSPERTVYDHTIRMVEQAAAAEIAPELVQAAEAGDADAKAKVDRQLAHEKLVRREELLPYMLQSAVDLGYRIDLRKVFARGVEGTLARYVRALLRAIKRLFRLEPSHFTVQDLLAAGYGAAQLELPAGFGTEAEGAINELAKMLTQEPGAPGIGALRAAAVLRSSPEFLERTKQLSRGEYLYNPDIVRKQQRKLGVRPSEVPPTREEAIRQAGREEAARALEAPEPSAGAGEETIFSSSFNFRPERTTPIRSRDELLRYARTKKRPSQPWLNQEKDRAITNLVDYQHPFYAWLRDNSLSDKAWKFLKLVPAKLRARSEQYKTRILEPIAKDIAHFAKETGVSHDIAAIDVGWWATARHVPEANAALRRKFTARMLAGDKSAMLDLKRFDETQRGLHPDLGDAERGPMAAGLSDREAQQVQASIVERYTPQQRAEIERIANKIVAGFDQLKRDAIANGQINAEAAARFPPFRHYVALTGPNTPVWDSDQASDAFGSYISENQLRSREGRAGDTVSESALEALAERIGRVSAWQASAPFKAELNKLAEQAAASGEDIGLERFTANLVQRPGYSDIIWNDPDSGKRYVYRFDDPAIGNAILGKNREYVESITLRAMELLTRKFARATTQWVMAFGPVNMIRDVGEKSILVRSRGVKDENGNPVSVNQLFKKTVANALNPETWRAAFAVGFHKDRRASNQTEIGRWTNELIEDGGVSTFGEITRKGLKSIEDAIKKEATKAGLRGTVPKAWGNIDEFVRNFNYMFEIVSSISTNAAMRELGVPRKEASFQTLDLMNFQKAGAKTKWLRAMYAFFNPAMQSGFNLLRQIGTKRGVTDLFLLVGVSMFIQSLMRMMSDDDPELGNALDQKGSWEMDRNLPVTLFGVPLKLPIGFGMPQFAWAITNSIQRWISGRYTVPEAVAQAILGALKNFYPVPIAEVSPTQQPANFLVKSFTPTVFRPMVDMATDTDAWGTKLTTYYPDKTRFRSQQGKLGTPVFYKDLARTMQETYGMDLYPEHWQKLAETVAWGPFGYGLQSWVDGEKEKEGRKLSPFDEIPMHGFLRMLGASRFVGGRSRYLETRYYQAYEDALETKREQNAAKAAGREAQWLREDPKRRQKLAILRRQESEMRILSKEFNSAVRDLQGGKTNIDSSQRVFQRIADKRERSMRAFLRELKSPKWQVDDEVPQ